MKILNYIKDTIGMHIFYRKLKREFYRTFLHIDDVIEFGNKFVQAYKGSTPEEIRDNFIKELAGFAHEQAERERSKKRDKGEENATV